MGASMRCFAYEFDRLINNVYDTVSAIVLGIATQLN